MSGNSPTYEIDVQSITGYNLWITGAVVQPGDLVSFVRKDSYNGDATTACGQVPALPNKTIGAPEYGAEHAEYGGIVRRECHYATRPACDNGAGGATPAQQRKNCVNPETGAAASGSTTTEELCHAISMDCCWDADTVNSSFTGASRCYTSFDACSWDSCQTFPETDPDYHPACRFASEFNLEGTDDTRNPDRFPNVDIPNQTPGSAPTAPPWWGTHDDDHEDQGLIAGNSSGVATQADGTYEETGTYYMCYRQQRDEFLPGFNEYAFFKYIVIREKATRIELPTTISTMIL